MVRYSREEEEKSGFFVVIKWRKQEINDFRAFTKREIRKKQPEQQRGVAMYDSGSLLTAFCYALFSFGN